MARGLLAGLFWGVALGGMGLVVASQVAPVVQVGDAGQLIRKPSEKTATGFGQEGVQVQVLGDAAPDTGPATGPAISPSVEGQSPEAPAELLSPGLADGAATSGTDAGLPSIASTTSQTQTPVAPSAPSGAQVASSDAPQKPAVTADNPALSSGAGAVDLAANAPEINADKAPLIAVPATPATSNGASMDAPVSTDVAAPVPLAPATPDVATGTVATGTVSAGQAPQGGAALSQAPSTGDAPGTQIAALPALPSPSAPGTAPNTDLTPRAEGQDPKPSAPDLGATPRVTIDQSDSPLGIGSAPAPLGKSPGLGSSSNGLPNTVAAVRTDSLPRIGDTPVSDGMAKPLTAMDLYGVKFDNLDNRYLMSVVLIDDGLTTDLNLSADQNLVFSLAVYASQAGVTARSEDLVAQGFEVLAISGLPAGATPSDAAVILSATRSAVPQAIAFMDGPSGSFQASRETALQVLSSAGENGMGVLTYARGLNAITQLGPREGVPSNVVFRDIDGAGQGRDAIKRFLDQAAFRAAQGTPVVLVGHARDETILALQEWALGNRAATVLLAPVSAIMMAGLAAK